MRNDRIVILGIGCRFPGGINDTDAFWKLVVEGREAVRDVPPARWNVSRFSDPEPGLAGKSIAKRGGFVDGIDQFDPQFFGISPREAPCVGARWRGVARRTRQETARNMGIARKAGRVISMKDGRIASDELNGDSHPN